MKRQKTPLTDKRYSRQDGCLLVHEIPIGAGSTQPGLPRPALPGEVASLRTRLLYDMVYGQLAQEAWLKLFGSEGLQEMIDVRVQEWRSLRTRAQNATQEG